MLLWDRIARGLSLKWALKKHGLVGSVRWLAYSLPYHLWLHFTPAGRRELAFDALNAVDTEGIVHPSELDIALPMEMRREIIQYAPTRPRRFFELMARLNIDHNRFLFIDIGCGKGRVLLLAAQFPFKRIIGIEFSSTMVALARSNVSSLSGLVDVVCADACAYQLPEEPLLLYVANPFTGSIFERFVANVEASILAAPRPVYIVYTTPVCEGRLAESPLFNRVGGRRDFFAIYAHVQGDLTDKERRILVE